MFLVTEETYAYMGEHEDTRENPSVWGLNPGHFSCESGALTTLFINLIISIYKMSNIVLLLFQCTACHTNCFLICDWAANTE